MDLEIFHARFQFRPWFNRVWPFGIFMGHTYWLRESRSQLRSIPTTLSTQVVASFREQLADEIFTNGRIRTSHRGNYCCQFFSFDSILFSLHLVKLLTFQCFSFQWIFLVIIIKLKFDLLVEIVAINFHFPCIFRGKI